MKNYVDRSQFNTLAKEVLGENFLIVWLNKGDNGESKSEMDLVNERPDSNFVSQLLSKLPL